MSYYNPKITNMTVVGILIVASAMYWYITIPIAIIALLIYVNKG